MIEVFILGAIFGFTIGVILVNWSWSRSDARFRRTLDGIIAKIEQEEQKRQENDSH